MTAILTQDKTIAMALQHARETLGTVSVRAAAAIYGVSVPQIHKRAGCAQGALCTGPGCRVNARRGTKGSNGR